MHAGFFDLDKTSWTLQTVQIPHTDASVRRRSPLRIGCRIGEKPRPIHIPDKHRQNAGMLSVALAIELAERSISNIATWQRAHHSVRTARKDWSVTRQKPLSL